MKTLSDFTQAAIDSPYVSPVLLCKMELPGLTLYLCDRVWGTGADTCMFQGQLYEPIVNDWGISCGEIGAIDQVASPGGASIKIDNNVPVGGADTFSRLTIGYDFYYADVTFSMIFEESNLTQLIKEDDSGFVLLESGGAILLESGQDPVILFKGSIESVDGLLSSGITVACSGYELDTLRKFSYETLAMDDYPGADPDDVGRIFPLAWGKVNKVPFLAIDVGVVSSLVEGITAASSTIKLTSTDRMGASGSVLIDLEQVSYASISDTSLVGCTRGVNSTTAVAHNSGAAVGEIQSEYVYGMGHAVNDIGDVFVSGVRQEGTTFTAYTGQSGEEHSSYPGRAVIAFPQWPQIQRKVNLAAVDLNYNVERESTNVPVGEVLSLTGGGMILDYDDGTGIAFASTPSGELSGIGVEYSFEFQHYGSLSETVEFYLDSALVGAWRDGEFRQYVSSPAVYSKSEWPISGEKTSTYRGVDGEGTAFIVTSAIVSATSDVDEYETRGYAVSREATNVPLGSFSSETVVDSGATIAFPAAPSGNLSDITIKYSWSFEILGDWVFQGTPSFYAEIDGTKVAHVASDGTITNLVDGTFSVAQDSWATTTTKTASRLDAYAQGYALTISVAVQSCYTDDYNATLSITGNSMADSVIGGPVSADVFGYQDDSSGNYTGTPNALIERPDHVLKHILMDRCGFVSGEIHSPSYGAAGAFYGSDYPMGVVVLERPNTVELLHSIADQAKSLEFWEGGQHRLVHIPSGEVPVLAQIQSHQVDLGSASLQFTDRVDLVNTLTADYKKHWDDGSYQASVVSVDAPGVATYGTLNAAFEFPFIASGEAHAQAILDWKKDIRKSPKIVCSISGGHALLPLERGDVVQFDVEEGGYLESALGRLVVSGETFRIHNIGYGKTTQTVTVVETP